MRFALFFFLALSFSASAETVSLSFDRVPVIQLLQASYRNMLKKNFIIDPSLAGDARVVTISVRDLDRSKLKATVDAVLREAGITAKDLGGITYFFPTGRAAGIPGLDDAIPAAPSSPSMAPMEPGSSPSDVAVPATSYRSSSSLLDDGVVLEIYVPQHRQASELQALTNHLLGGSLSGGDRVLLSGQAEKVEKARLFLEAFDRPPMGVKVQAALLEFSSSESKSRAFGVAITALGQRIGASVGAADALSNFVRLKDANINAVLSAVEGDSRFSLIDAPSTLCDHGQSCRIQAGSETPTLGATTVDRNGNAQQTIIYRDSGTILEVKPEVMEKSVRLTLSQTVSSFTRNNISNIDSPSILKRALNAVVTLSDSEVVVLGGLNQTKSDDQRSGLSFLPRWLDSTASGKQETQLLLVLHVTRI